MTNNSTTKNKDIISFILSGDKLSKSTNDLEQIARVGGQLYEKNKVFIKEKVKDNWFLIIEPLSGTLIASDDQLKLYNHARKKFPDTLFFSVGLLKENILYYYAK